MRILFITPYPFDKAPSQRFRFEQYLPELDRLGWKYRLSPFVDDAAWKVLYAPGHVFRKTFGLLRGYMRRWMDLLTLFRYDVVFIHREASPFGPPVIEWMITRLFKKYTVYDFDDAIWIPNTSESNRNATRFFKSFSNMEKICKWSTVISAGNSYLANHAVDFNRNVKVLPTTIDTESYHNEVSNHETDRLVIGWTGSHSTLPLLDTVVPVLQALQEKYTFDFHVICDVPPKFRLKNIHFIPWKKETEIKELLRLNIGIMPLPDNEWTKGKCGFKALQYMALGIPPVVSAVGANNEIVDHGVNGLLCHDLSEWHDNLERLITDRLLLNHLSSKTRAKVESNYSVYSQRKLFISLFVG
jgi:glycosyltransferase involved in cell wall biosynthesis